MEEVVVEDAGDAPEYKFTPKIPKQERFVKIAQAYHSIHLDMGPAHELGHIHQTRPGLKWHGIARYFR